VCSTEAQCERPSQTTALIVLQRRTAGEIKSRIDLDALRRVRECEHAERQQLRGALAAMAAAPARGAP
jgi:hypothetical protein